MRNAWAVAILVLVAGCTQNDMPEPLEGARLFARNCAACHGDDARGAGPETFGIGRVPPDLTGLAADNGGVFPRARVLSAIDGYRTSAHPQERVMPEFGADPGDIFVPLSVDGTITPAPRFLVALLAYLEDIQRPGVSAGR